MALTEQQRKWNERIEREMKKSKDAEYLDNFPIETKEIYLKLREIILSLYPNIQIVPKKSYISFKAKSNFLDVQPQSRLLKCVINVKSGKLKDSKKISRNISKLGHFGCGDYDFSITSLEDIENTLDLIKQSYDVNS